jgi:hypothetical protein
MSFGTWGRLRMARKSPYFTLLRVVFGAISEAHALRTARHFAKRIEEHLEDDDSVIILQTEQFGQYQQPETEIHKLREARNILLRLQYSDCHATAQFLDRIAWFLESGQTEVEANSYNWNRIMEIAEQVLKGSNPLD